MAIPALELRELACVRGGRALFDGLHLLLPAGRLLRVSGANGTGKTSLLRMVCGLLRPAAGAVLWRGTPVGTAREDFHRQMVYLGHAAALKDDLTAVENLVFAARLAGLAPDTAAARSALCATGLQGHQDTAVRALSQGQRRRVVLARLMLSADMPLWVLDEPFDALDVAASAWLVQLISAQVARGGVVLLTHHQAALAFPATVPQVELAL